MAKYKQKKRDSKLLVFGLVCLVHVILSGLQLFSSKGFGKLPDKDSWRCS